MNFHNNSFNNFNTECPECGQGGTTGVLESMKSQKSDFLDVFLNKEEDKPKAKYCSKCGESLYTTCMSCGGSGKDRSSSFNLVDYNRDKYCSHCGRSLPNLKKDDSCKSCGGSGETYSHYNCMGSW